MELKSKIASIKGNQVIWVQNYTTKYFVSDVLCNVAGKQQKGVVLITSQFNIAAELNWHSPGESYNPDTFFLFFSVKLSVKLSAKLSGTDLAVQLWEESKYGLGNSGKKMGVSSHVP